jgi:heptosyltransferase III
MRILIARTGGIGDSVLTLPLVNIIKKFNSEIQIDLLGNDNMLSVGKLSGLFDNFYSVDEKYFANLFSSSCASDDIKSFFGRYEEVYFFSVADEKERMSAKILRCGVKKCRIQDPRPHENFKKHIFTYLAEILDADYHLHENVIDDLFNDFQINLPYNENKKFFIIHPGSGSMKKNWPVERFCNIAEKYENVKFILGPAEIERGLDKKIPREKFDIVYTQKLEDLFELMGKSKIYFGNDSGISHLSAACGIKSIVLFGPTNPVVWRPPGKSINIIKSPDGSMDGISEKDVIETINKVLPPIPYLKSL